MTKPNKLVSGLATQANATVTTNGMAAHISTKNANLDFYGMAAAARTSPDATLQSMFEKAYREDKNLAVKNLFHLRDIRGGKRERRAFRVCFEHLVALDAQVANNLLPQVPEFGRWDDMLELVTNPLVKTTVVDLVKKQLADDQEALKQNKNVSLLAKWLPSENTSSKETVQLARNIRKALNLDSKTYRQTLSALRRQIGVVEVDMSAKDWSSINYNQVPSNASTRYRKAFAKNDSDRYVKWQQDVKTNLAKPVEEQDKKIKVNAAVSFPHDLVGAYNTATSDYGRYNSTPIQLDQTIENQWKSLPDYVDTKQNIMVLPDVSGSMGNGPNSPLSVSVALAIYFAERNSGAYKDCMVSFESKPKFVQLTPGGSLAQHVRETMLDRYAGSTNLGAAFDLILNAAVTNKVSAADMPSALVIVSDMQFNAGGFSDSYNNDNPSAFEMIDVKYQKAGYKMPQIVFWNVSGTSNVPVMAQKSGACFVSGSSPDVFKSFLKFINTGECLTPMKVMLEAIDSDRYKNIIA